MMRGHWSKAHKIKKADRELIAAYAKQHQLVPGKCRRRVSLRIVLAKGRKAMDEDNIWKSLLDALTHAELIVDDSAKWLQRCDVIWLRSGSDYHGTFVLLEDV